MAIQGEGDPEDVSIEMLESIENIFTEVDQYFVDKQKGVEAQFAWHTPDYKAIKPRINTNLSPVKRGSRKIKMSIYPENRGSGLSDYPNELGSHA